MAHIDCVIDTNPMAQEISSVSNQIEGTTAAVVGMRVAVIQAEEAAAEHVCANVNKGFYTLIHSQISQKIAKLQSEVDSHLMKLNQLRKQLLAIKDRMERDYGMISGRYLKLFNGLNKNLEQRVFELDRPTMEFAVKDVNTISNRKKLLTATVPVAQSELLSVSQKMIASNIKYRGRKVIDSMSRFLTDMEEQEELTNTVLLPERMEENVRVLMLPVLICETNNDKYGNKMENVILNETGLNARSRDLVKETIRSESGNFNWNSEQVNEEVRNEFRKYLSASLAAQRVKDMANRLFDASDYQILKKS